MLGKHKPQQQATLAKKIESQRLSFAFAFVIQKSENPKSGDLFSRL